MISLIYKNKANYIRKIKRLMYLHFKDYEFNESKRYYQIYKDLGGRLKLETIINKHTEK